MGTNLMKDFSMNIKRFIIAAIVLFVFIFAYESYVHGILLMGIYAKTPTIWRSYDQMMTYVPFNILIMALISLWTTFIFTRFFKEGGWKKGVEFGCYIGVLSGIQAAGAYYYLPISATLAASWFVANCIETIIGGFLIGLIYRNR